MFSSLASEETPLQQQDLEPTTTTMAYRDDEQDEEAEADEEDAIMLDTSTTPNGKNIARSFFLQRCLYVGLVGLLIGAAVWLLQIHRIFADTCSASHSNNDPLAAVLQQSASIQGQAHGVVAADHVVCSQVGVDILSQGGGNAVDAAVATALCLGVANPASSGVGGGAFALVHASPRTSLNPKDPPVADYIDESTTSSSTTTENDDNSKTTRVMDCREVAPGAATQDMYAGPNISTDASSVGGLAIAVPGELHCLQLMHHLYGKLAWADVVQPAMDLARHGVPVSAHLARDVQLTWKKMQSKNHGDGFSALANFFKQRDNGKTLLKEGQMMVNPALADTLQVIAEQGTQGLYTGGIAKQLVADVQAAGGILSLQDLAQYKPVLRTPLVASAGGFTLMGVPPPSSGGAAILGAARFLAGYAYSSPPLSYGQNTLTIHRMVEALRHVFAIRMSLSDPKYQPEVNQAAVHDLVQGSYMDDLRKITLDNDSLSLSQYGGTKWAQLSDDDARPAHNATDAHEGDRRNRRLGRRHLTSGRPFGYLQDDGTSHFSVIDKDGNAVSMTTSVNQIFGSYVFSESTGILLGNTMDDFGVPGRSNYYGLKPSEANFIVPGKRPLSSMSPTLVFQGEGGTLQDPGRLVLAVGGSGGPKIITSVLQVLINYCYLGMSLFDAVARPRVHEQLLYHDAKVTTTEKDTLENAGVVLQVPQETKDALLRRGHDHLVDIDYAGTVQAAAVDPETGRLAAVSDIRKGGTPAGY